MKILQLKKLKLNFLILLIIVILLPIHIVDTSLGTNNPNIQSNWQDLTIQTMSTPNYVRTGDGNTTYFAVMIVVGGGQGYYHHMFWGRRSANKMIKVLTNHGWQQETIKCLTEEEATTDAIFNTFQWLNNSGEDEDDVILFFIDGHGYNHTTDAPPIDEPDGKDERYFPWDEASNGWSWDKYILDDELSMQFAKLNSKNIVIIIDTCHSGGFIDGTSDLCNSGRVILTSCDVNEAAGPIIAKMQWLYPYYVTQGFKGRADKNSNDWVSAEEAFNYAHLPTMIRSTIFNILYYFIEPVPLTQHPQLFDGWPTVENNQQELDIINLAK